MRAKFLLNLYGIPLVLACLTAASGCGLMAQVMRTMQGSEEPAKFDGLKGKRVAVVCFDANTLKGPGSEAEAIAKAVSTTLGFKVKDIKLVRQAEIADWIDNQTEDVIDFREVGQGVKADFVIGIDLRSYSIHEGATLLKGRSTCDVKVYDMSKSGGTLAHSNLDLQVNYPESGARHVTENEANFRTLFTQTVASKIARDFFPYDRMDDYGKDAKFIGD